jgi:hypothetical protein
MTARPKPCSTGPTAASMGRVSVCRAACGGGAVELFSRCKNRLNLGTRHQTSQPLNECGRYRTRVSQLSQLQRVRMGQKTPMKSTVSQLSQLSQSQTRPPEANDHRTLPKFILTETLLALAKRPFDGARPGKDCAP